MEENQAIADLRDVLQYVVEDGYCSREPRSACSVSPTWTTRASAGSPARSRCGSSRRKVPNAEHSDLIADVSTVIRRRDKVIDGVIVER